MLVVTSFSPSSLGQLKYVDVEESMEVVGEAVVVEEVPVVLPEEQSGVCGGPAGQSDPEDSPSPTASPRDELTEHNVINGGT